MEGAEQNRRRRLRSDLRGDRPGDEGECGAEAGVDQAGQASAQDGGDGAAALAGKSP